MATIEQENPNKFIKDYVERDGPKDWQHAEVIKFLYWLYDRTKFTWFSPRDETQLELPQAVLAISKEDVRMLAAYRTSYNPNGIPLEIILNEVHIKRAKWELAESLVHEQLHLFQDTMVKKSVEGFFSCSNNYHNRQFVDLAADVGLHIFPGAGFHWKPADGQFERLMNLLEIERPKDAEAPTTPPAVKPKKHWWDEEKPKGSSTLTLYTCEACTKSPVCKLRSGRKNLALSCLDCSGVFHPNLHF